MSEIRIEIKNLAEIKAAFSQSPKHMAQELARAIKKAVITIEGRSRRNTPVDTGRLRASTYSRFAALRGEVGTNTDYDLFVHEGTRFMKGRPYLRLAVEQSAGDTDVFITDAVQNVLNEIGRKV